ncbi:hypothetical protein JXA32_07240 [Candidatus Sumerlaeota bacterium]|nr:hypothetical protein [Candidatus Sumerlaeota bacterium]
MPIKHKILPEFGVVISSHIGDVPDDEFLKSYKQLITSSSYNLAYNLIIDLRQTDSAQRSPAALRTIVTILKQVYEGTDNKIKIAMIAQADLSFGLGRMFQAYSSALSGSIAVFRDPAEVVAWLGAPEELLLSLEAETPGDTQN